MQSAVSLESGFRPGTGAPTLDPSAVFAVLGNERCQRLLGALGEETLTAQELAERVDIPMSTIYRHLDQLTDIGLLTETVRINTHGRNHNQYSLAVDDLTVSLGEQIAISVA